jgi:hypothetical protein
MDNDYIYTLSHYNAVDPFSFLNKISLTDGTVTTSDSVWYYTGHRYQITAASLGMSYLWSGTGIYNTVTNRIMLFTWHGETHSGTVYADYTNWGATFNSDFELLFNQSMNILRPYTVDPDHLLCNPIWPFTKH